MSLRNDIAGILCRLQWETMQDEPGRPIEDVAINDAQGPGTTWGDLADECIRQMEWARNKGEQELFAADTIPYIRGPLTLAPKDWKP